MQYSYPEAFLHFVWRTLYFDFQQLKTVDEQLVIIKKQGNWNTHQGPDFLQAQLLIDNILWAGHIEIHLETEDWYRHEHEKDEKYNGVILHVVAKSSKKTIVRQDGTSIPEVEIGTRIPTDLLKKYLQLQYETDKIPCQNSIHLVDNLHLHSTMESLALERMMEKTEKMRGRLNQTIQDWEQVFWECLMYGLGGTNNAFTFENIAQYAPIKILKKLTPFQIEAVLLGVAKKLENVEDDYSQSLQTEWTFLQTKHQFSMIETAGFSYLRMRPATFPDLRIAQVAHLIQLFPNLIALIEVENLRNFIHFEVKAQHEYWQTHYKLAGESSKSMKKVLGTQQKEILLINTFVPFAYLYKNAQGDEDAQQVFEHILTQLPAEKNHITQVFKALGIEPQNALQSQGLIQLKRYYCDEKRCLSCAIGYQILKQ